MSQIDIGGHGGVRETGIGSTSVQVVLWFLLIGLTVSIAVGQGFPKMFHGTRDGINRHWGKREKRLMVVMSQVQIHLGNTRLNI